MDVVNERCAGLDVHKRTVVACVRLPGSGAEPTGKDDPHVSGDAGLEAMRDWLAGYGSPKWQWSRQGCTGVPSTRASRFHVMLVNARHVKHLPGRKTDVKDSEWLAQLPNTGLLRGSFTSRPGPIRDLRDLTRSPHSLCHGTGARRSPGWQRWLANVKLGSVVTDIMGVTGRAILEPWSRGRRIPKSWPAARGRFVASAKNSRKPSPA